MRKGRRVSGAEQAANPRDDGYQLESSAFRVEEFVLPALFGQIHAAPGAGVAARELPLSVQVNWANGGPARDWPLTVSAMLHPARRRWPATRHTALNRWKMLARRR